MPGALIGPEMPWAVWTLAVPLACAAAALVLGPRARHLFPWAAAATLAAAGALALQVATHGQVGHALGGWQVPLGIRLRADGLAAALVLAAAVVAGAVGLYARAEFADPPGRATRAGTLFWPLLLLLWGGLNAVFLGADLFNLYVALELVSLTAVALATIEGRPQALVAGMRYLLTALLGSAAYLLGTALLYGAYGTLDMALLAAAVGPQPATWAATALVTAGLLAKTALFPLHFWLPAAHASAPAPASALLSGLVVKASFYVVVRLWFDVLAPTTGVAAAQLLGALGAAAILWGSVLALRQVRLKLLVAYSTVAQLGYLFLMFPLAGSETVAQPWTAGAWIGGIFHAVSHASAKAAMFLAAGTILHAFGHDRIAGLAGAARALPMTVFAFGAAGLSLMGLPPSGGFIAKWLLLTAALAGGQWVWAAVMLAGGLLAAAYVFRTVQSTFAAPDAPPAIRPVPASRQVVPLALAGVSVALGIVPYGLYALLQIGRPAAAEEGLE